MSKKRFVYAVTAALTTMAALVPVAPAVASCSTPIDGIGCIESIPCKALGKAGIQADCIM